MNLQFHHLRVLYFNDGKKTTPKDFTLETRMITLLKYLSTDQARPAARTQTLLYTTCCLTAAQQLNVTRALTPS